jgi:hypothetical protein
MVEVWGVARFGNIGGKNADSFDYSYFLSLLFEFNVYNLKLMLALLRAIVRHVMLNKLLIN